ncbi:MAG TPA: response regulator [Steroidobacteraceae bacterium]|nr:response regulator [Steroidobacteraceae bacterium]
MVVLIVEDEVIIAYCSAATLEDAGHAVLGPARTSAEALELARNRRPEVALIDIDLEIPGAGVGLAQQLRAHYGTAVVFTTGQGDVANAYSDTAVAVLTKPFDPADLPRVVASAAGAVRHSTASRNATFTKSSPLTSSR